jgi:hypothetical protein
VEFEESLRESYKNTVLTIQLADGGTYRTSMASHSQSDWPFDSETIHVVTAWNPRSQLLDSSENQLRNQELLQILTNLETSYQPCRGLASDGSWHEDGFAILGISNEVAIELGVMFEQNAIFKLTQSDFSIVDSSDYESSLGD